jgi:hypothetical protein
MASRSLTTTNGKDAAVKPSKRQLALLLVAVIAAVSQSGCRWNEWFQRHTVTPTPIAFAALPTRDEALAAINANTQRVQSLQTQAATISVPGVPSIGAEIALERPQKLRFRAGTNLLGPELDLGSNDELFWFWAASAPGSSVYFARHEQFATSPAREMLAIEPAWLIQALGLVEIDPATVTEGPFAAGNDRVQVRTTLLTSAGNYSRLIVFHEKYAWVLEQHVYDERGQLLASSRTSDHEYHALDGVSLPKRIEVQVPQGQLRFQLDVDRWAINQPAIEGQELYDLPRSQLSNYPFVDLGEASFVAPGGSVPVQQQPPARVTQVPDDDYRDRIRGMR